MHIAIIMDGNGRWAQSRGMSRISGHREGARRVEDIVKHASDLGVTTLTLYAFSTENWQRPSLEVRTLFQLIKRYLRQKVERLVVENVRINFIGRRDQLPKPVVVEMAKSESATKACTGSVSYNHLTLPTIYPSLISVFAESIKNKNKTTHKKPEQK